MEWLWWSGLVLLYLVLVFTVCMTCFRKGHTVLGVLGIFLPLLWLIGAVMPPVPGSSYSVERSRP